MADYSDKLVRKLIRELILEDRYNLGKNPEAGKNREASPHLQLLSLFKDLFSVKGLVTLTTLGIIYDGKFTVSAISFGVNNITDLPEAYKAYSEANGTFFEKLGEASRFYKDAAVKNKLNFLSDVEKLRKKSLGAGITAEIIQSGINNKLITTSQIDERDAAISDVILTGKGISDVFDPKDFEIVEEDSNGKKIKRFKIKGVNDINGANKAIADAETDKKWINQAIMESLKESMKATSDGKPQEANEKANSAYRTYLACIDIQKKGEAGIAGKTTIFDFMDDSEDGLETNFDRDLKYLLDWGKEKGATWASDIEKYLTDKATKIASDVVTSVTSP